MDVWHVLRIDGHIIYTIASFHTQDEAKTNICERLNFRNRHDSEGSDVPVYKIRKKVIEYGEPFRWTRSTS